MGEGEQGRRKKKKGGGRFYASTLLNLNRPSPIAAPSTRYSLIHGQAHAQLQECEPVATKIPPLAHTHTHTHPQPPHPSTPTPTPSSFEHVTVHHPHSEDTSTTLLQCAGHFTEQLVERSAASAEGLNSAPSST